MAVKAPHAGGHKSKAHPMDKHIASIEQSLAAIKQHMMEEGGGEEQPPSPSPTMPSGVSPLGGMAR